MQFDDSLINNREDIRMRKIISLETNLSNHLYSAYFSIKPSINIILIICPIEKLFQKLFLIVLFVNKQWAIYFNDSLIKKLKLYIFGALRFNCCLSTFTFYVF